MAQCLLLAVFSQLYLWYNNWTNFNKTWHKQPFGVKISLRELLNKMPIQVHYWDLKMMQSYKGENISKS